MNADEMKALRESVGAACDSPGTGGWHPEAWEILAGLGVQAVSVAEEFGGAGGDLVAAEVVLSSLGTACVSVPIVETDLVAGHALEAVGVALPSGVVTAALAFDLDVVEVPGGRSLSGVLTRVPWGCVADCVVVLVGGAEPVLAVVEVADCTVRCGANVAGEPRDDLLLDDVFVSAAELHPIGGELIDTVRLRGAFGRAAQIVGAAHRVYEETVRYAGERQQFGRPLASLQSVQHMIAGLAGEVCAMTVVVESAAAAVRARPQDSWLLEVAHARVAGAAKTVAEIGHQIHGAMGFTQEHDLHLATTRLWAWRDEYRSRFDSIDSIADAVVADDEPLWHRLTR
ncbi:acyl-CoA dehydrogenase [Rhodococcus sp. 27YEA15]|uniref:acyl-CoA dehydrogenase family protein n=1 Tax=Rhodococcus sp. 27YEA15 TaxID=3156259 RepID=UPI003C7B41DB